MSKVTTFVSERLKSLARALCDAPAPAASM